MKQYSEALAIEMSRILKLGPVVPVIAISKREHAVPLAQALYDGGLRVFEITLRTPVALDAISDIRQALPDDAMVGAGTVVVAEQVNSVLEFDGQFIITPGMTSHMLDVLIDASLPVLAGTSSAGDVMLGLERGMTQFKLFPASAVGGVPLLKALNGPFKSVQFCPTGGISRDNMSEYLSLQNVVCVGGSWFAPPELVEAGRWSEITEIARQTLDAATPMRA